MEILVDSFNVPLLLWDQDMANVNIPVIKKMCATQVLLMIIILNNNALDFRSAFLDTQIRFIQIKMEKWQTNNASVLSHPEVIKQKQWLAPTTSTILCSALFGCNRNRLEKFNRISYVLG